MLAIQRYRDLSPIVLHFNSLNGENMGYLVSKLENIPARFDWYFFLVGDYRTHSQINNFFRDDFAILADRLGEKSALVAQNAALQCDLQESLLKIENHGLGKMLNALEKKYPGLLMMNKHPKSLNFSGEIHNSSKLSKDTKIIYVPFANIEKAYDSTATLLADLVAFSHGENTDFIKKTSKGKSILKKVSTSFSVNLGIIAINFDWN